MTKLDDIIRINTIFQRKITKLENEFMENKVRIHLYNELDNIPASECIRITGAIRALSEICQELNK
jgi:hypothetical protein